MKTKKILIALSVVMLYTSVARAQIVEPDLDNGNPVINCDDMPSSLYATTSKGNTQAQLSTLEANKTLTQRFAVSKTVTKQSSTWENAFTTCAGLGDGWRLPTQRELMLIWVLYEDMKMKYGFVAFAINEMCWSATQHDTETTKAWVVDFTKGQTLGSLKSGYVPVRCIQELQ